MSSFTIRATMGIARAPGISWFSYDDKTGLIIPTGPSEASVFIIIQYANAAGAETYHAIRYGNKYIGPVTVNGINRLTLVNKPFPWYFVSSNSVVPTVSTVDLLTNQPFYMALGSNKGVAYGTVGSQSGLICLNDLDDINEKIVLSIESQSQPVVDASRIITAGVYSPAPSASTIYSVNGGATTINGFDKGVDGQSLMIYGINGATITVNNLSGLVAPAAQIVTPSGGPTTTPPDGSFEFIYNGQDEKWHLLTQMAGTSGTTVSLSNGTAANPSLSFAADPDTGIFRDPADNGVIRVTNNGVETLRFTTTGLIPLADNTLNIGSNALAYQNVYTKNVGTTVSPLVLQGTVINPPADNVRNFGSVGTRWNTLFATTVSSGLADLVVTPNAAVLPSADSTKNLGGAVTRWNILYARTINSGANDLVITPNLAMVPSADSTKDLGAAGTRWNNTFTNNISAGAGDLTLTTTTSVLPSADNTKNLGTVGTRWNTTYTTTVDAGASDLNLMSGSSISLSAGSGFIIPSNDNLTNLGSGANRFQTVLATAVNSGASDLSLNANASVYPAAAINLGNSVQRWSNIYAANWFPSALSTDAFLQNGSLTPDLQTTNTDIAITYPVVRSATWYRQGNMVFVTGQIQWDTLTAGTGDIIILNSTPAAFPPAFSTGTPGSITYAGMAIASGTLSIIATTTAGRINIMSTTDAGVLAALPIGSVSGIGQIYYHVSYYTTTLA